MYVHVFWRAEISFLLQKKYFLFECIGSQNFEQLYPDLPKIASPAHPREEAGGFHVQALRRGLGLGPDGAGAKRPIAAPVGSGAPVLFRLY